MYEASVAVHVVAAIVGFGSTFTYPVIQWVGERSGERAVAMQAILAISRFVAVPAAVVVGLTGVYQIVRGPYDLRDAWLAAAVALYLGVMAVATAYLAPAYARGDLRAVNRVGPVVAAAVVANAVLMVVKP